VTIPARLRSELGFGPGRRVVIYVDDGRLVLERPAHLLSRLQAHVLQAAAQAGRRDSAVDELLVERRAEAAAEDARQ
jgi:bifunctional DNA-binding transcriptional regulator/antitoxin component of YhaV-PrlF toxin-antitoxin module